MVYTHEELNFLSKRLEFKKTFRNLFVDKLQSYHHVAIGEAEAKIEYSFSGNALKYIFDSIISKGAEGIPFVGPFAAELISTIPTQVYEHYEKKKLEKVAQGKSNQLREYGASLIEQVIEETSHEITRVFEFQIAVLKDMVTVCRLAKAAVEKIFAIVEDDKSCQYHFDVHGLFSALVWKQNQSLLDRFSQHKFDTVLVSGRSQISWYEKDIFVNVGLREETETGFSFKVDSSSKSLPICGFRSRIFGWDPKRRVYYTSDLDSRYNHPVDSHELKEMISYVPYYRLVRQSEVDGFLAQSNRQKSFNQYLLSARLLNKESMTSNCQFVLRNARFPPKTNLDYCDFSGMDMSRVELSHCSCQSGIYLETRLFSSYIHNTNLKNSKLILSDLSWADVVGSVLCGNTNLRQTNMKYTVLGDGTDLTDNLTLGESTDLSLAVVVTNLVEKYISDRLEHTENEILDLKKSVEELQRRDNERRKEDKLKKEQQAYFSSDPDVFFIYNVRDPKDDFVGRKSVIKEIETYFLSANSFAGLVVSADGGMGKTQVVLEAVRYLKDAYESPTNVDPRVRTALARVYWIEAESSQSLRASFKDLATRMKIITENRTDAQIRKEVVLKMKRKMSQMLLIYDNVVAMDDIVEYLPMDYQETKHHVIITSRKTNGWPSYLKVINLQPFSEKEAIEYVKAYLYDAKDKDITALAETLRYRPLELSVAVPKIYKSDIQAYLKYYQYSMEAQGHAEIIKMKSERKSLSQVTAAVTSAYDDNINPLHAGIVPGDYGQSSEFRNVYNTVSIALQSIDSKYNIAIEILRYCSYLYAESIPLKTFAPLFESETVLLTTVCLLEKDKLIYTKIEHQERFLFVHRLHQDVIRQKTIEDDDELTVLTRITKLVVDQMEDANLFYDERSVLKKNSAMLNHALSIFSHYSLKCTNRKSITDLEVNMAMLLLSIGQYFTVVANYEESKKYYRLALDLVKACDEQYSYVRGFALYWLSYVHVKIAMFDDASTLCNQAVEILVSSFGKVHPAVANCYNVHGQILLLKGELNDALVKFNESLSIRESIYGHDHPAVAASLGNIGVVYSSQGNVAETLAKYNEALRIYEKINGRDHPAVATCLSNIGLVSRSQGNYADALMKLNEGLRIRETIYGRNHPDTAAILTNIGSVYAAQGNYADAFVKFNDAMRVMESIYGHDHPTVATCLGNIANTYGSLGNHAEALLKHSEALRIKENIYGNDHFEVASTLNDIGLIYETQENYANALIKYKEALRILEAKYGHNHPIVAERLNKIAGIYFSSGNTAEAMAIHNDVLNIYRSLYGNNHPDVKAKLRTIEMLQNLQRAQRNTMSILSCLHFCCLI